MQEKFTKDFLGDYFQNQNRQDGRRVRDTFFFASLSTVFLMIAFDFGNKF